MRVLIILDSNINYMQIYWDILSQYKQTGPKTFFIMPSDGFPALALSFVLKKNCIKLVGIKLFWILRKKGEIKSTQSLYAENTVWFCSNIVEIHKGHFNYVINRLNSSRRYIITHVLNDDKFLCTENWQILIILGN